MVWGGGGGEGVIPGEGVQSVVGVSDGLLEGGGRQHPLHLGGGGGDGHGMLALETS